MSQKPSGKSFEQLYQELSLKLAAADPESGSVRLAHEGTHAIGKKIVEEAAEVWMAAEYEGKEALALEISQLLYHIQILMHTHELGVQDIYKNL